MAKSIGTPTKISSGIKWTGLVLALFIGMICYYNMHPAFGKRPSGERLERIKQSPQYRDGKFRNTHVTPQLTRPVRIALSDFLFHRSKDNIPKAPIPAEKIDWGRLPADQPSLVWLGHSTYLIHIDGKNILVDPVLGESASPIPGSARAFKGTTVTTAEALPEIDYLFISHDHYDHMDYGTLVKIREKVGKVICSLGVGAHLEYWGYASDRIIEKDWWDEVNLGDGFRVILTPARHFSGRSIWSANTLWTSYALKTPSMHLFLGGDSGYDTHFAEIGRRLGPFDLAILENGQYDLSWKFIHMQPEEVIQATRDLGAKALLPVHSGKFSLANHAWYEPLERISALGTQHQVAVLTPAIGHITNLSDKSLQLKPWWKQRE
ncbi:MBL fold metallo-hydrolase [Ravibacter arvi]|uniref:MBL fold metallo-hydrolase n=1 Tax=Ravibacter arvi TaxID=2051041 RepID=A0ABP8LUP2_9BACT